MESPVRLALVASALALSSCGYIADRGLDFLDQYRIAVGVGSVAGVRSKSLGLYDTGLMFGVKPNAATLGWRYGRPRWLHDSDQSFDVDQSEVIKTTSMIGFDYGAGSYVTARNSAAVLPAVLTWVDSTPTDHEWYVPDEGQDYRDRVWIWSGEAFRRARYEQIHAFDIEFDVAIVAFFDNGYSPGELVDFLLGFLTIDIAGDDGRL